MKTNDFVLANNWLKSADAILITASNGLSIAEGYHIFANNDPFRLYFGPFIDKYGVDCLIRGVFTPMSSIDKHAYMAKVHQYMIEDYYGSEVMKNLLSIVDEKPYFILTSNADTHFQINGFDSNLIFEIEGNFDGMKEGSEEWSLQRSRFAAFLQKYQSKQVVLFELGIGSRNQLIKAPTMEIAAGNSNWKYITMNMPGEINVPAVLENRTIALTGDISQNLANIR